MNRKSVKMFFRNVVVAVTIMMLWPVFIMTFAVSDFRAKRKRIADVGVTR